MKMKVILEGGSCIDVDLSQQSVVISQSKISILNSIDCSKAWTKCSYDEFILPLSMLKEMRIVK